MKQRRTRIAMGPGGVVYLLTTALILGASIYTQANLLFLGFGLMVGGLVVSVLVSWQSLRKLEVQRLLPAHGVAGEPLAVRYLLTNNSWLPVFGLILTETWGRGRRGWRAQGPIADRPRRLKGRPFGWVMHLGPRQTIQAEAPCWPLRRGPLRFERIIVGSSFPFGVIRKAVEFDQPGELLIYPHLYRMNRRVIGALSRIDPVGVKHLDRSGGMEEFYGLREYRVGDSLKIVDWKRSARTGDLVAREMAQPSPPRIMLLLDLSTDNGGSDHDTESPDAHAVEDRAIALAASVVCDAYLNSYQIGLAVRGVRCPVFPMHHSLPHRSRMLEALSRLDRSQRGEPKDALPAEPTVVIRPGAGDPPGARGGRHHVLGADDLEQYVIESDGVAASLLTSRAAPRSRRSEAGVNAAVPVA